MAYGICPTAFSPNYVSEFSRNIVIILAHSFKSTTSVLRMQMRNRRSMKMDIRNRNMLLRGTM
jgi:hypothetical protein